MLFTNGNLITAHATVRRISYALMVSTSLLLVTGCASMGDSPLEQRQEQRLSSLEQKLDDIERRLDNMSNVAMLEQVESLRTQVRQLRGQVEEQQYKTETANQRQRQQFLDLDTRLRSLEGGQTVVTPPAANQVQGEAAAYQNAFAQLKNARYSEAATSFKQFLRDYPDSQYADNAQYWLSESHYVSREFDAAKTEFNNVIRNYPNSAKVSDAELKLGFIAYEQKEWATARTQLNRVVTNYPQTTAAQLATQRLSRMDQENR